MVKKSNVIFGTVIVIIMVVLIGMGIAKARDNAGILDMQDNAVQSEYEAKQLLYKAVERVKVTANKANKSAVSFDDTAVSEELPKIDNAYPAVVKPARYDIELEIYTSPEKGGVGVESWLTELSEQFNKANKEVNGKRIGIKLRSISSGTQLDYIVSGAAVPDAITPSAAMWADMLKAKGVKVECINERMVGNVAGILVDKSTVSMLEQTYGTADIQAIIKATEQGSITAGYTNPFSSTSGLNFLAATLYSYDSNPLSEKAINGFNAFQNNVPFVAYNTMQMANAAERNTFTSMILEYQTYVNNPEFKNNYAFIPYGVRHDNPLYAVGELSADKLQALNIFNDFCMSKEAQVVATQYGFNQYDVYKDGIPATDGNTWLQMQKVWKKNKNMSKPIAAVFVLDTSGSMVGSPLNMLKSSLTNSISYINSTNYIGVISYSDSVNIDLPIGLYDLQQQAYFQGAIDGLAANGGTATYSAVAQAELMLQEFMVENPDVAPMIFVLSDGEARGGATLNSISGALQYYKTPIYTIGYNANIKELERLSTLNEAASINADTDDVVYKLKNLFNANL